MVVNVEQPLIEKDTVTVDAASSTSRIIRNRQRARDSNVMQLIVRYRNKEYNICGSKICSLM